MFIQVKSSNGITQVTLEAKLLSQRKVFVEGEITTESANDFMKQIIFLNTEDAAKSIDVFINSPGGEINAGLLMYDIIQSSKAPIRMFCTGHAYSMGAVLFASGRHGRYLLPHSELMIHEPLLGNRVGGNASSIRSVSEKLMKERMRINKILAQHTGRTMEEIAEATEYDHYFNSEESVKFGLADRVVPFSVMLGE